MAKHRDDCSPGGDRSYYPVLFDLKGRLCVVVGGGAVALRKVKGLLLSEARVRVIGPQIEKGIKSLAQVGRIETIEREYREGDLKGAFLAWAATDSRQVNLQVRKDCERRRIAVNVADDPGLCDFILPSVIRKGSILVAISTSGLLPMLSAKLRMELTERIMTDYVSYARKVGQFRCYLKATVKDARKRRQILKKVGMMEVSEAARMSVKEMKKRFMEPSGAE